MRKSKVGFTSVARLRLGRDVSRPFAFVASLLALFVLVSGAGFAEDGGSGRADAFTAITVTVNGTVFDAVLYDTPLAREVAEQFPVTISAVQFGGREYYGSAEFRPKNIAGGQRHFADGDIAWCEAYRCLAIFYAQTDNPDLNVDINPIGRVTSDLSQFAFFPSRVQIVFTHAEIK